MFFVSFFNKYLRKNTTSIHFIMNTWRADMKYTNIKLETLEDKNLIVLFYNKIRRCINLVLGDRYVKLNEI